MYFGLHFRPAARLILEGFSDADWASNLDDRRSTTGIFITLGGNLVAWGSRKQQTVARSNTDSEYRVLSCTATEVVWVQSLLTEIGVSLSQPVATIWCDNQGARLLAYNPIFHSKTKHIEVDVHYIRELIERKKVDVCYILTDVQPADLLTKALPAPRFTLLRSKLSMAFAPSA
ncbi:hypothetical protein Dimus_039068 [Dionaea muscipula]